MISQPVALSRGQDVAVAMDESQAVSMILKPGQMSLHHIGVAHGSKANNRGSIHYSGVVQHGTERQITMLVRGSDSYRLFDLAEPPATGQSSPEGTIHCEALRRMMTTSCQRIS